MMKTKEEKILSLYSFIAGWVSGIISLALIVLMFGLP